MVWGTAGDIGDRGKGVIVVTREEARVREAAEMIRASRFLIAFTGAGASTESGLPDFRSPGGLWRDQNPVLVASSWGLQRYPERFFAFYRTRLSKMRGAQPNRVHSILATWERQGLLRGVITQNVDGLHQKAGSRNVVELHGALGRAHCDACGRQHPASRLEERGIPRCACGGLVRPSVVLFGERLPTDAWDKAVYLTRRADVFLVVGSSLTVAPANLLPRMAAKVGRLVICNRDPTPLDPLAHVVLRGTAGDVLEEIDRLLRHFRLL